MWRNTGIYVCIAYIFQLTVPSIGDLTLNKLDNSVETGIISSENLYIPPKISAHHSSEHEGCRGFASHVLKPVDCEELLQLGYKESGVYHIWPKNRILDDRSIQVFCDMETDGGGWTVIQRRDDFFRSIDYFYKDWKSYKEGFGNIEKDFWLGNDNIFALTNQRLYSARFELVDFEGEEKYALYDIFYILDEAHKYKLTIQDYSGTANDSMIEFHNGQNFTTKDNDNDNHPENCADLFKGAWWYNRCHTANLNGLYFNGQHQSYADGINWHSWKGFYESLMATEIMIRPKNFRRMLIE